LKGNEQKTSIKTTLQEKKKKFQEATSVIQWQLIALA
jgi:hypothetical protein